MSKNVVIVDDDHGVRWSFDSWLKSAPGFSCAGTFSNGNEGIAGILSLRPDLVLLDIGLPEISGLECLHRLKTAWPGSNIIMFTARQDMNSVMQSLVGGACGYVVKGEEKEFGRIFQHWNEHEIVFSQTALQCMVKSFSRMEETTGEQVLSFREREILGYFFQGMRAKDIARERGVATRTVSNQIYHLFKKLEVKSWKEALTRFLGALWIPPLVVLSWQMG